MSDPIQVPPPQPQPARDDVEAAVRKRHQDQWGIWRGILSANVAGVILVLMNQAIISDQDIYAAADFTLVPLVMGIIGEFYWRTTQPSGWRRFGLAAATAVMSLFWAAVFLGEGVICLVMASPLLICVVWFGALFASWLFGEADSRLQASIIPLLVLLMIGDSRVPHHYTNAVTDSVTIRATPSRVWRDVAACPRITQPPDYWLWRIGLPCPIQAMAAGDYVGADRQCVFTRDVVFGERITVCRPGRELTFVITHQPRDPEILHHLVLERGQFLLRGNRDGTTTLIGTSWYRLNVYPAAYFDLWTRDIIRHVHLRVMTQIKTLAEKPG